MKNQKFIIYHHKNVFLDGEIKNDVLTLKSEIHGDDYDSELYMNLTKESTLKLFAIISVKDFIEQFKNKFITNIEEYFKTNEIEYSTICI